MSDGNWFQKAQGKKWILLFVVLFVNLLSLEAIMFAIEPLWGEINYYLADFIGIEANYIVYLLLLIGIPVIYSAILVIFHIRKIILTRQIRPHIVHKITTIVLLILFDSLLCILILLFGEDSIVIFSLIENISPLIYLGMFIALFFLLYALLGYLHRLLKFPAKKVDSKTKGGILLILIGIGYGFAFSLPFIFQPVNVIAGDLPPKPQIIAHRGGGHIAPENTLIAADCVANLSVPGWEIDVQLSYDGIPFLLHDDTLKRTTNVSAEFPGRENDPASNFTLADLRRLDAGSWFVEKDPYRAIAKGVISRAQAESYRNVQIPTLTEAVNFTRDHGLILDVDFKGVPSWHPNYTQYFNICLSVLKAAGIDEKIWIATGNEEWLNIAKLEAPNMQTALSIDIADPLSVTEFLATGYDMINVQNGLSYKMFEAYATAGVPINTWTVDSVPRFSQLWCLGVTYVVTNEPNKFVDLIRPNWYLHTNIYITFWITVLIIGVIFVCMLKFESPFNISIK